MSIPRLPFGPPVPLSPARTSTKTSALRFAGDSSYFIPNSSSPQTMSSATDVLTSPVSDPKASDETPPAPCLSSLAPCPRTSPDSNTATVEHSSKPPCIKPMKSLGSLLGRLRDIARAATIHSMAQKKESTKTVASRARGPVAGRSEAVPSEVSVNENVQNKSRNPVGSKLAAKLL